MAKAKKKRAAVKPGEEELLLSRQESLDHKIMVILLIIIALVPLITRMVVLPHTAPTINGSILDTGIKGNAFTYLKMNILVLLTGLAMLMFLYKMVFYKYRVRKSFINIPTAALFILILLSCLFSAYSNVATTGMFTRHEGTLTYVVYIALFFIAANVQIKSKYLDYLVYALAPVILVNSILGLLAFYGINILDNPAIKALVISPEYAQYITEGSLLSTTINNPNYVSGIAAVIFVIFLTRFLFSDRIGETILYYILLLFTFSMLLTATSTSGFLTLLVVSPFVLVPAFQKGRITQVLLKNVGLLATLFLVYMKLNSHNQAVSFSSMGFMPHMEVIPLVVLAFVLLMVIGLRYKVVGKGMAVVAALLLLAGVLYSENLQKLPVFEQVAGSFPISYPDPETLIPDETGVLNLPSYSYGLDSGRLYIWAQTIDLIEKKPVLGYGLDTIGYYFPHYDLKSATIENTVVDKPHNMYLAMAFGAGIPALLAFLILVIHYLKKSLFLYQENINTQRRVVLLCILGGCLAYLFQGIFNDSIIGTAPIFWIIFGVGVSLLTQENLEV